MMLFRPSSYAKVHAVPLLLFLLSSGSAGFAGTLTVGKPQISGNQYTFPILLDSSTNDVAVMDFHFQYDPQVFHPVEAQAGPQADYSNKLVNANQASPGEYIVVLWGPNQDTLNSGEVARIVMEYSGTETPNTQLGIGGLTMANADGVEVASETRSLDVQFGVPGDDDPDTTPPTDKPETPTDTDTGAIEPRRVNNSVNPDLPLDLEQNELKDIKESPESQSNETEISQFAKNSKEMTREGRLAQLALEAQSLRDALPTPEIPQIETITPQNTKLDETKKNGIISLSSGAETNAGDSAVDNNTAIGELARAGGVNPSGNLGLPDEKVFWAENQSYRNMLILICGGVFIGLILLLSLRKKFFV